MVRKGSISRRFLAGRDIVLEETGFHIDRSEWGQMIAKEGYHRWAGALLCPFDEPLEAVIRVPPTLRHS